jgi:hypothetical protein
VCFILVCLTVERLFFFSWFQIYFWFIMQEFWMCLLFFPRPSHLVEDRFSESWLRKYDIKCHTLRLIQVCTIKCTAHGVA